MALSGLNVNNEPWRFYRRRCEQEVPRSDEFAREGGRLTAGDYILLGLCPASKRENLKKRYYVYGDKEPIVSCFRTAVPHILLLLLLLIKNILLYYP
jgi:hypothetical protein